MEQKSIKEIRKELKKEGDEYTMRFLVRPLSFPLSFFLIRYTNITPNQISIIAFITAVVGSLFFFQGGYTNQAIGAILSMIYIILDCVDGNIARVKKCKSLMGRWLDGMGGFIITPLLLFSLVWGMHDHSFFVIGSLAMLAYPMQYLIIFFYKFRIAKNNDPLSLSATGINAIEKLRFLYGSALFFPLVAIAVILQQVVALLLFYAIIGNLVWIITLVIQYREIKKNSL